MYYQIFKELNLLKLKKKFLCLILAAVSALVIPFAFSGCNKDKSVIRINEVTHSVFYAPLYLADALGYFQDEGYTIELENGGGANNTMAAVLSGSADIGFCGPEAAVYTFIGGDEDAPKVFGQLTDRDGSFLVGRKPEPNFDWRSLEGKDVLAGRPGGVPLMTFQHVMRELNVTPNYVTNIDFNMMTSAFDGGTAEYCTMFEPVASDYQKSGKGYIVASVGAQAGKIPYTCFMAKTSYIEENGEAVEALLRAVTKAVKYVYENDSTDVAEKIVKYFVDTTVDSAKTSLDSYKAIDAWVKNMAMEESSFNRLQDVIEGAGELTKRVDFKDLVITETAQKIYNEIYAK